MGKLQKNQSGFSAVEGLLIVLVLAVIGFGGYFVYHTQKKTMNDHSTQKPTKTSRTTTQQQSPADPYAGWKAYTTSFGLRFRYPANWYAQTYGDSSIVTVSSISNPTSSQRGTQNEYPQYNNNLVISTYLDAPSADPATSLSDANATVVQPALSVAKQSLCLVGTHNSGQTGNPITGVEVADCNPDSGSSNVFVEGIPFSTGKYFLVNISSVANGGFAKYPVSENTDDYKTALLVIQSMTY